MPANRNTKKGKRTATGELVASIVEGERRSQVYDPKHIAYSQQGVSLTHLTVRAKVSMGFAPEATKS